MRSGSSALSAERNFSYVCVRSREHCAPALYSKLQIWQRAPEAAAPPSPTAARRIASLPEILRVLTRGEVSVANRLCVSEPHRVPDMAEIVRQERKGVLHERYDLQLDVRGDIVAITITVPPASDRNATAYMSRATRTPAVSGFSRPSRS